jgi:hypothetical protein
LQRLSADACSAYNASPVAIGGDHHEKESRMPAAKTCVVCGIDVVNVKRVKDPHGNYYCQVCYDARLADKRARATGNVEVDFECNTCRRFFTVEDVYDEAGVIICKSCFAARTRPPKKPATPPAAPAPVTPAPSAAVPMTAQVISPVARPTHVSPVSPVAPVVDSDVIELVEDNPVRPRSSPSHGVAATQPVDQLEIIPDDPMGASTAIAWHVHDRGQSHGPMSEQDLINACHEGRYTTSASIWKEGMADWVTILRLETLLGRAV